MPYRLENKYLVRRASAFNPGPDRRARDLGIYSMHAWAFIAGEEEPAGAAGLSEIFKLGAMIVQRRAGKY